MKTFLKTNLIAVFAVLLTVGTMSFKLATFNQSEYQWYEVDMDGIAITSNTALPGKPNGVDCNDLNFSTICAIQIKVDSLETFPATVSDAYTYHEVDEVTRRL